MLKVVIGLLTFLVVGSSLAYAQKSSPPVPNQTNFKVVDRRANWHSQGGVAADT